MSGEVKDGGQAFPAAYTVGPNDDLYPPTPGMSLRDWFAGQALAGLLSHDADETAERFTQLAYTWHIY